MKTGVILSSSDRDLFGIKVKQDTKNQFLSITDLQKAYESARWQYGWSDKRVSDVMQSVAVQERVYYLLENRGIIKTTLPVFMEMLKKEGVTKSLKGLGVWKATGARGTNQVSCDPFIWVLLAMELNPMIYAKVVVWLTDSLIFNRIEAGSEYMPMNTAIKKVVSSPDYVLYAKEINIKVFGQHQTGMRNLASAKELRKISDIERFVIQSIDLGFLKTESDIIKAIRTLTFRT